MFQTYKYTLRLLLLLCQAAIRPSSLAQTQTKITHTHTHIHPKIYIHNESKEIRSHQYSNPDTHEPKIELVQRLVETDIRKSTNITNNNMINNNSIYLSIRIFPLPGHHTNTHTHTRYGRNVRYASASINRRVAINRENIRREK